MTPEEKVILQQAASILINNGTYVALSLGNGLNKLLRANDSATTGTLNRFRKESSSEKKENPLSHLSREGVLGRVKPLTIEEAKIARAIKEEEEQNESNLENVLATSEDKPRGRGGKKSRK